MKKVFENNMVQFLQTEKLSSAKTRSQEFDSSALSRVGVTVASRIPGDRRDENVPLVTRTRSLRKLIDPEGPRDLHRGALNFQRRGHGSGISMALPDGAQTNDRLLFQPGVGRLRLGQGEIYKPVMVTDVAVTWKTGAVRTPYYRHRDLLSAAPTRGALVRLMTYQNQAVAEGYTDTTKAGSSSKACGTRCFLRD